jgi:C4-dicarboxylate-specific signal transduction histidine kinase
MILGDQGKLQQALVNILLNAIQASADLPEDKRSQQKQIDLSLSLKPHIMTLTVRDYGTGIDEAILDQIFDPFFTTKEVGQGTGLGLSISLGIVQNHKGQLQIENAQGGGVMVNISLPLVTQQAIESTELNKTKEV